MKVRKKAVVAKFMVIVRCVGRKITVKCYRKRHGWTKNDKRRAWDRKSPGNNKRRGR